MADAALEEQVRQPQTQTLSQANKKIVNNMFKHSPISCGTFIAIWLFFALCLLLDFTYFFTHDFRFSAPILLRLRGNNALLVRIGQIDRLFFAMFLHGGLIHIIMNSISYLTLLLPFQKIIPKFLFVLVYFVGGIQGNMLADFFALLRYIPNLSVGASTSICAIVGLNLANYLYSSIIQNNLRNGLKSILISLAYIIIISLLPGIDLWGHVGSLISGSLLGIIFLFPDSNHRRILKIKMMGKIIYLFYSIGLLLIFFI